MYVSEVGCVVKCVTSLRGSSKVLLTQVTGKAAPLSCSHSSFPSLPPLSFSNSWYCCRNQRPWEMASPDVPWVCESVPAPLEGDLPPERWWGDFRALQKWKGAAYPPVPSFMLCLYRPGHWWRHPLLFSPSEAMNISCLFCISASLDRQMEQNRPL